MVSYVQFFGWNFSEVVFFWFVKIFYVNAIKNIICQNIWNTWLSTSTIDFLIVFLSISRLFGGDKKVWTPRKTKKRWKYFTVVDMISLLKIIRETSSQYIYYNYIIKNLMLRVFIFLSYTKLSKCKNVLHLQNPYTSHKKLSW